jgi:hypothetical protein
MYSKSGKHETAHPARRDRQCRDSPRGEEKHGFDQTNYSRDFERPTNMLRALAHAAHLHWTQIRKSGRPHRRHGGEILPAR